MISFLLILISLVLLALAAYGIVGSDPDSVNQLPYVKWFIVHKQNGNGEEWWEIQYRYLLFRHPFNGVRYLSYDGAKNRLDDIIRKLNNDKVKTLEVIGFTKA